MTNGSLNEKKQRLVLEIANSIRTTSKKTRTNSIIYTCLILAGIVLSVGAALAGFLNQSADGARIAGAMAFVAGATVTVESTFKFGEKRDFLRIVISEYRNLQIALNYRVDSEHKFQMIVDKFQIVNTTLAKALPRGKGMQTTKLLYENLDRKGILPVPEISEAS